jgi:ATP-dependent Clp protease ATP-binding subunit ClpA
MTRAARRADTAIRLIDELLSSRKLQRATRLGLLKLRRELQELRKERDVGTRDLTSELVRWSVIITKLYAILDRLFD